MYSSGVLLSKGICIASSWALYENGVGAFRVDKILKWTTKH